MDDFILILHTKDECKDVKNKIETFLHEKLKLELNHKSRYYPHKMGVNFCGYRTFCTHRLLRNSSKTKIKNKVKKWNKQYRNNSINFPYVIQSLNSWIGHCSHCNSYTLKKKILNSCEFLYNDLAYKHIEENVYEDSRNYLFQNANE